MPPSVTATPRDEIVLSEWLDAAQRGYLLALLERMPAQDTAAYPALVSDPQVQFLLDCAADVVAFLG